MIVNSAFEAPAIVACLDDIAVVGQSIKQRGGHLGVAEDAWPFAEGQVGGDDDRGALVEPADEMEQELTARLGERQMSRSPRQKRGKYNETEREQTRSGLA